MKTEILAIVDRSGSMHSIVADAIGGYNAFLADQQAVEGEARLSLVLFDDHYEVPYAGLAIGEALPLTHQTFVPRGGTALLDAIGRTLSEQGARIEAEGWADKVIVTILTDGGENMSREFTTPLIQDMVKDAEAKGWSFVFLAANQDAFATGAMYGFNPAHTQGFAATGVGVQAAYATISNTTRTLRGA